MVSECDGTAACGLWVPAGKEWGGCGWLKAWHAVDGRGWQVVTNRSFRAEDAGAIRQLLHCNCTMLRNHW